MKYRPFFLAVLLLLDVLLLTILCYRRDAETGTKTSAGGAREKMKMAEVLSKDVTVSGNGPEEPKIALTFDDGPNHIHTLPLLEGLKERGVKATFFLLGQEVVEHPEIAKRIAEDGHLIGNHSFYHEDLSEMETEEAIMQVGRTNEVIYEVTGQYPQLIRPPFGHTNKDMIYEPPMVEVLWTIDSRDWELSDVGMIMQNVLPEAREDAIILMHDASKSSVQAAFAIVDCLQEKGYCFVTLDEILFDRH